MHTAIVTGASSGIGRSIAALLLDRHYRVIGTSRDSASIAHPVHGVEYRDLDLTSSESIAAFASSVAGLDVDVLVNNAGESQCGPLEELPIEALRRLFQLNVLGHIELTQLLLPSMRQRGRGRIVFVGSMLASFPLAFRSSYVATKAAINGFATAARMELEPFGILITTVEPGAINTGLSERRTKYIKNGSPYSTAFAETIAALDANEASGVSSDRVARTILKAISSPRPGPLYAVGSRAPWVFAARRVLPRRIMEVAIARSHGLTRSA